jgi:hypothetical protein
MLILFLPSCAVAENKKMPPVNGFLESKAICLDYRYIEKTLTFNKETLRLSLLRSETEMIEIWAGRSRETWTIVLRSLEKDIGCIMGTGIGLFLFKQTSV